VEAALDVMGGKWKTLILWKLKEVEVIRYNKQHLSHIVNINLIL